METIYKLQERARTLRNKTQIDSITPEEVGGLHLETLAYLANMEQNLDGLGIRKVYPSVQTMEADLTPIGINGKPLRLGQLVIIFDESAPVTTTTGNIYAFQKPGWVLVGNIAANNDVNVLIEAEAIERQNADERLRISIKEVDDSLNEFVESKGHQNGIAPLDSLGKVPASFLPAYVDDVVEFDNVVSITNVESRFLPTSATGVTISYSSQLQRFVVFNHEDGLYYSNWSGEEIYQSNYIPVSGKVFLCKNNGKTYRWSGSQLTIIGSDLALGETAETAFPGNRGVLLETEVEELKNNKGAAVGNIFNVSAEVPIAGYYTLCDTVNPQLSAVHVAWEKGKVVNGLIISFEISAGKWKTYQYVGKAKAITPENWGNPDNWQDFGSLAAGSEKFIIIDNIIPCVGGYYTIESALNALLTYEEQSSIVYRKEGLVISYRIAERQFETKQFIGSLADFSDASLWKDFGGGGAAVVEIEVTDTPKEGGSEAFSSGGAFAHLPTTINVNTESEGVVKLQLCNESGEAIGDEIQFAVGTGTGGSSTIVAIEFKDSPLYAAFGSNITTKAAIRSVTDNAGILQVNDIESIELIDRSSGVTLYRKNIQQESSVDLEDYSFDLDFTKFFTAAGVRRFKLVATANGGSTGSRNITVTAVDATCTCTQTLQYNVNNPITTTSNAVSIPMFKFANNQSDKGISAQIDIKIEGEWQPLSTIVVNDTYSHNIQLQPKTLGLKHGSYPIRIQGTDVASGTKGNIIYTAIMVLEPGNGAPVVSMRYDDRNDGKVANFETLALDIAVYNPSAAQSHIDIMLNGERISQLLAVNTRTYTYKQQIKGFENGEAINFVASVGSATSGTISLQVAGSVIDAELTAGALYNFDFSSRTNDEADHAIENNGYTMNVVGSNWRSNGFANYLGENCLRVAENVKATLPHMPFAPTAIESTGTAIQFAFATANIKDKNARLMECYDENSGAGFYVTGNEIAIFCKNGVRSLEKRKFEQGKKITAAIVAEPATLAYERAGISYALLCLYLNGERVAAIGYPVGSNNLFQEKNISFNGTNGDIYLYNLCAWNTYFEWSQAFKNYLVRVTDSAVMVEEYDFENVLKSKNGEGKSMVQPDAELLYARGIPYLVEVASEDSFNEFDGGTSTSDNFTVDLHYYHPIMPWRSFVALGVRKRRQGTTSAKRPKKNPRYYLNKASSITPIFPEYTNEDALLTYALFAKKKVRVGENTIPVDIITVKIDFSDSSGVNDCGTCDMMNYTYRSLGGDYLTPAQRFFDGTWKLDDISIEGLQMNHSTASHPVAVYRSTSDTLQDVYFEARGNWKEDKGEQTALGFMNTPGYNLKCLNYQDESFIEFIGTDGETLADVENRFKATSGLDTSMPYLLSLYCGRNYRIMRYIDGEWKNTTGSMYQKPNGEWEIEGDVLNPVEGFELLMYQDMCWWRGVSSVAEMMEPSTMKSSWVQKLIDKGEVSGDTFPAWTYYFECMVDNDQLAINYALGKKVPYQLYDMLAFAATCDKSIDAQWATNWRTKLHLHANPKSVMSYYGFTDYDCAKDQQAKNMQPMWFLEHGATVINGEYSENALIMYLNKIYDADGVNDKDNDGGCDTDPEVDPAIPTSDGYVNPFAGWNSILWICCREQQEVLLADSKTINLREIIAAMRNTQCEVDGRILKPFSPDGAIYFYCTKRQQMWPKVVSSYDGYRKYIHYTASSDTFYFYALQGLGLTSLPAFIRTRWRIRDGYYQTGDFFSGVLSGRIACEDNATITIKAAATGYFGIGNDSPGTLSETCFLQAGASYTFTNFKKDNGTLLFIYQADRIAEIDLSKLTLSDNFNFSVMSMVEKITTGSDFHSEISIAYAPLTSYALGELPFLRSIDIRGTAATSLDCSKCPRIEQILATGSALQTLTLAETSPINDIALPTTMTEMLIVGLPQLQYTPSASTGLRIASMPTVVKVWVENSPNFNAMAMIAHIVQSQTGNRVLAMVRVVNQSNLSGNGAELVSLIEQGVGGIDLDGNKTAKPVIEGEYLITSILEQYEIDAIEAGIDGITIVEGLNAYVGIVNEVNAESFTGNADADIAVTIDNVGDYIKEYNRETYAEYLENYATENMDINEFINL